MATDILTFEARRLRSSSGSLAKFTANAAPRYGSADCGPRLLRRTGAAKREGQMRRVLFVGQQPETVDFTNPMLPPGMNAERIHAGIALALKQMAERGWHPDLCLLRPDETAGPDVERRLKAQAYDCVVIGAGIRLLPHSLSMFEAVINAVHRAAPDAAIAFNTRPEDSADAAARWLKAD
jgi:hypothetical protein